MSPERVYVIGATGNVGTKTVHDLLKNNVQVTILARSPEKAKGLFAASPSVSQLTIVQGDYNDLTSFRESIAGHTRLVLLAANLTDLGRIKHAYAEAAYAAGVKQVVDISSQSVSYPWRVGAIGRAHRDAEERILAIPNRGAFVALRPSGFMSNTLMFETETIKHMNTIFDAVAPDEAREHISPNDIGALAAIVAQEPVEKHGDAVYEMTSYLLSGAERARILSKALGREIKYQQVSSKDRYDALVNKAHMPHFMAYDLATMASLYTIPTAGLSILLGREPETYEEYIEANKAALL
ncbi:hypothetical protein BCR43DRAFT_489261 [Syncephalastrum racemosum]|uniref:NmrA-like domain-containing protein n=1 Tax=Syncephalastrum racemosum TaxID=13706 RepID=A0A1X2HLG8_SYNRA|nr:hypothetical protein BCR43DRAFT_489261 [Syncephalastrum racemosum]